MASKFVPRVTTPIEPDAVRDSLLQAWPTIDRETAASLLALIWVETGRGRSCHNWNVGNLSASETTYGGAMYRPAWYTIDANSSELMKRLHQMMLEKKAPSAFRAYPTLSHGMRDYVSLLRASTYAPVLEAASTGEIVPFVKALSQRYSKDYGPQHWPAFTDCRAVFVPMVAHLPAPKLGQLNLPSGQGGLALAFMIAKALS